MLAVQHLGQARGVAVDLNHIWDFSCGLSVRERGFEFVLTVSYTVSGDSCPRIFFQPSEMPINSFAIVSSQPGGALFVYISLMFLCSVTIVVTPPTTFCVPRRLNHPDPPRTVQRVTGFTSAEYLLHPHGLYRAVLTDGTAE